MAGYSANPLAKKLGILPGCRLYLAGAPAGYVETLGAVKIEYADALSDSVDIAHVFTWERAQLERVLRECRRSLDPSAVVWISWPKKSAKIKTDVSENTVRELALPLGFVDIKVCAIDPIWSGLKLVVRKKLR
jgi:tetrahydromethanopterin S-methyltransferase subunit B